MTRSRMVHECLRLVTIAAALSIVAACQAPEPPRNVSPAPEERSSVFARGTVSHYGHAFAGKPTASGASFDPEALTMAHRTLPFGTRVRVTNLKNQRSVEVVVNDRGPFVAGRIADLSLAAARRIGMVDEGIVAAELRIVAPD